VVVGLLTSLFAFGLSRNPSDVRSVLVGRRAPSFTLARMGSGGSLNLSQFRGQVVVMNFWASWCRECREEHDDLVAAFDRYRDQGVVLVGIPFEDTSSAALAFQHLYGGGWPQLVDPDGRTASEYGVYGVPETFVIGRGGVIEYKRVGPVDYSVLSDVVTRLLRGKAR
jgi:cytochrome c biogenesis protein CcmG, thiol:disulfide interchange protein DsbE